MQRAEYFLSGMGVQECVEGKIMGMMVWNFV